MTALPEGFVPHDGGPCPVHLQAKVEVVFRSGQVRHARRAEWWTAFDSKAKFAEHDLWKWESPNHDNDIIAYRLKEPDYDAD